MAALLRHPCQRLLLDVKLEAEPPFIVLEGTTAPLLADIHEADLPSAPGQVWNLAVGLATALAEAHRLGLAHGDLRPGTIRWQSGRGPKLDFTGVRCFVGNLSRIDIACLAPELTAGKTADSAADIYALGSILSWLLSVRPARAGAAAVAKGSPRSDPSALSGMMAAMLASDPDDRPSAQAIQEALCLDSSTTEAAEDFKDISLDGANVYGTTRVSLSPVPTQVRDMEARLCAKSLGRFRLLELIGEGGLGKVYRGEDMMDGSPAAIKILHPHLAIRPDVVKRFQKEARLLSEVRSPFVANILEVNRDGDMFYLALEFIAGQSLGKILKDQRLCPHGRMAEALALPLAIDVARALADAHRRGIIHRDIKPQNIMVLQDSWLYRELEAGAQGATEATSLASPSGESGTKLCDFGLARHVVESESLHLTQDGATLGTPLYMSPEQAAGMPNLGPSTDIYALGATLYTLLTGRPPFQAESALALSLLHAREPVPPMTQFMPQLSDGICRIVAKCLAKKPPERYLDGEALLDDLERCFRGEPSSMVVHPRCPVGSNVLHYDWSWELAASAEQLWPFISDTERLNRAAGIPAIDFSTQVEPGRAGLASAVRRQGALHKAGVRNVWREHPFEWVEGKRMGVLREYSQGVFLWLTSTTELTPRPEGGCTLSHKIRVEPRNLLGRVVAGVEVGFKARRRLEQVYRRIDAYLAGELNGSAALDPFEEPAELPRQQRRRLQQHLETLLQKKVAPDVVSPLGEFLECAPDQEVARIRPLALARRLGLNGEAVTAACLHGLRIGLFVLQWDILCPLCRIPADVVETLKALKEHGHCAACNADFTLDFANSVEMIFRVHPDVARVKPKRIASAARPTRPTSSPRFAWHLANALTWISP